MWRATINTLYPGEEDRNIFFSESPCDVNKRRRKKITEIIFEEHKAKNFGFVSQASLQLYSFLEFNGIVVDFGHDKTLVTPVVNGYTSYSSKLYGFAGRDIDEFIYLQDPSNNTLGMSDTTMHMVKTLVKEKGVTEEQHI